MPSQWLLITVAVVFGLVAATRVRESRPALELVVGTVVVTIVGLVFVYWATPLDPTWHLRQSGYRVIAGPLLFSLFLLPALLPEPSHGAHVSITNRRYPGIS